MCVSRHELALERQQELQQMKTFFMAKTKRLEPVNLASRVYEIGLESLMGSESWPEVAPCRELRTKAKHATGEGFTNPYIYADLRKFVPTWCTEHCPVALDDEGGLREGGDKSAGKRLDFSVWMLAWDRYAIGMFPLMDDRCTCM